MDQKYSKPLFLATVIALAISIAGYIAMWCLARSAPVSATPAPGVILTDAEEVFLKGSVLSWDSDRTGEFVGMLVVETGTGPTHIRKQFQATGRSWRASVVIEDESQDVDHLPSLEEFVGRGWTPEYMQNGARVFVPQVNGYMASSFGYLHVFDDRTLRFVTYYEERSQEVWKNEVLVAYPYTLTYRAFLSDPIDIGTLPLDPYAGWQRGSLAGVDFRVPPEVHVAIASGTAALSHRVPWPHTDPCDFKGDAPALSALTDLDLALSLERGTAAEIVARVFPYGAPDMYDASVGAWKYGEGFIERTRFGSREATKVIQGVEGCGLTTYFIPLEDGQTLVAKRKVVTELGGHVYLNIPADVMAQAIVPEREEAYVEMILSSVLVGEDRGI